MDRRLPATTPTTSRAAPLCPMALRNAAIALSLLAASALTAGCTATGAAVGAGATAATVAAQERPASKAVSDTQIRIKINDLLLQEDISIFRKVNLQVNEGRVLLSGNVEKPEHRVTAVRLAWKAPGVREVINEIEVNNTSGLTDYAQDLWISTQLRSKLLFDTEVSSINYSVETVNQNIYLMGIGQNQWEVDRVVAHAKDIDYVRRVVSYVKLKDDPTRFE